MSSEGLCDADDESRKSSNVRAVRMVMKKPVVIKSCSCHTQSSKSKQNIKAFILITENITKMI